MTARVLVVDDLLPNLKLLEARLSAEYFEVLTATNGVDALKICANGDLRHCSSRCDDAGNGRLGSLLQILRLSGVLLQSCHSPQKRLFSRRKLRTIVATWKELAVNGERQAEPLLDKLRRQAEPAILPPIDSPRRIEMA